MEDPNDYKMGMDRFKTNVDLEDIYKMWEQVVPPDKWPLFEQMVATLVSSC